MFDKLKKLLNNSHSPYSGYRVASIVIDSNGNEWKGVNVESVSFSATICAERTAINTAFVNGVKPGSITEVHILAFNTNSDIQKDTTPCGVCRQVIAEQSNNAKIFIYNYESGNSTEYNINDLLPHSFKGDDLIV